MKKKNWTAKEVEYIQVLAQDVISLNTIVSSPDGELETEFGEMILDPSPGPEELAITKSRKDVMLKLLAELRPREQEVMMVRYGFRGGVHMTLQEVANKFGLTRERIRQIEAKSIENLKKKLEKLDIKVGDL